jgi:glycosyltransferase involved in cell wall biosynthesis
MKASVLMITFNHEEFIAQALESALMQQVNFDYEIVIGEDCSTDSTRSILNEYRNKYPDIIRLLLPDKNVGMHKNFIQTLQACQGQYIALLEGDDCWTSPQKLQKQVDYLDNHSECVICFHNVIVFYKNKDQIISYGNQCPANQKEISTLEDLLLCNFIPTASVMCRRGLVCELPDWAYKLSLADWPFHILNAHYGKIGYINEVMAAYRLHSAGAWNGKSREGQLKETIKTLENMSIHLDVKYQQTIKESIYYYFECLANLSNYDNVAIINSLNLKDINLIIFPDWSQSENLLYQELVIVITNLVNHPDKNKMVLLIHIGNLSEDEVNLFLSDVVMNLLLEEDLDVADGLEISLVGQLEPIQWQALLTHIHARIILQSEDYQAMSQARAYSFTAVKPENIPAYQIGSLSKLTGISN